MNVYDAKMFVRRMATRLNSFKPIEKKVIFNSFGGKQYSLDPRAISEKMHMMYPEFKLVWVIWPQYRSNIDIPDYIKVIDGRWEFVREMATAAAYVTTNPLEKDIVKRKGQFFIQTWHGDRGFKRCLYEAWGYREGKKVEIFDNELTDLCIAASDYGVDVYHNAFRYNGEILKIGMPRNDKLIDPNTNEVETIKSRLGISAGTKVLIYAPTFSDSNKGIQDAMIDINGTLKFLMKNGEDWICLVRSHSASKGIAIESNSHIINVSAYPDIADLLLISDMLITDFSSCAGDFILRKKPVILALFDEYGYRQTEQNFRVKVEDTGFLIAHNQHELIDILRTYTLDEFADNCDKVLRFYGTIENGNSAEEICNRIKKAYESINI